MSNQPQSSNIHRLTIDARPIESDVALIRLKGEADLHTASNLRDVLDDAIGSRVRTIVVDMTGVTFIDSMMLGVLLGATRRTRQGRTEIRIVVDDPHVRRVFELTLLDRVLRLFPTFAAAVEGLGYPGPSDLN